MEITIKIDTETLKELFPLLFNKYEVNITLENDKEWEKKLTQSLRKTETSAFTKAIAKNLINY